MKQSNILLRLKYIITRTVMRPERVVTVVSDYRPFIDAIVIVALSFLIINLFSIANIGHDLVDGNYDNNKIIETLFVSSLGHISALTLVLIYGISISVTAVLLGSKPRFIETMLSFAIFVSIAMAIAAPFVAVIKLVDFSDPANRVSESLITIGPWIYTVALIYVATVKVHRTVAPRAIAYMGIAALPLILGFAIMWWELEFRPQIGF